MFNKADYSDDNPMHKSHAQVKDGVLCRDTEDPDRFYLIGEWSDIEVHRAVRKTIKRTGPSFVDLIEDGKFDPRWGGWFPVPHRRYSTRRLCRQLKSTGGRMSENTKFL